MKKMHVIDLFWCWWIISWFVPSNQQPVWSAMGQLIGNAVPVHLERAVGRSIKDHLEKHL